MSWFFSGGLDPLAQKRLQMRKALFEQEEDVPAISRGRRQGRDETSNAGATWATNEQLLGLEEHGFLKGPAVVGVRSHEDLLLGFPGRRPMVKEKHIRLKAHHEMLGRRQPRTRKKGRRA